MFEADGVDGGAICKRGFIHLQFAEKLEAPEAERHLGSWILERRRISFLPFGQDRRTLAYVGWHRRWCSRARLSPKLAPTYSTYSRECFRNTRVSICECGRIQFWVPAFVAKHNRSCSSGDRSFRCWIVELCLNRFPNAETHEAAILAFGGLTSSGVEVAPLLCFLHSSRSSKE
uniref:Uncharacterized protein n=1 Tax=Vespula pensylvanica TaxID=30213 RepID=A0A834MSK0_VESPE|nr:hypothetical protein H0235_018481 [Vespula pensylvanica]